MISFPDQTRVFVKSKLTSRDDVFLDYTVGTINS